MATSSGQKIQYIQHPYVYDQANKRKKKPFAVFLLLLLSLVLQLKERASQGRMNEGGWICGKETPWPGFAGNLVPGVIDGRVIARDSRIRSASPTLFVTASSNTSSQTQSHIYAALVLETQLYIQ